MKVRHSSTACRRALRSTTTRVRTQELRLRARAQRGGEPPRCHHRARGNHGGLRAGTVELVQQHDGSMLRLRKLANDYDVHDRIAAVTYVQQRHAAGEIVTGLLYVDPEPGDLHQHMNTVATPFNDLNEAALRRARRAEKAQRQLAVGSLLVG